MARRPTRDIDEAPPLTAAELAEMRPARQVHSPDEFAALASVRKRGRPFTVDPKVPVTIRLDAETAAKFRATGPGWQTRVSSLLTRIAFEREVTGYVNPGTGAEAGTFRMPRSSVDRTKPGRVKARA